MKPADNFDLRKFITEGKLLRESLTANDFPKFESYIESLVPKNRRIQFYVEGNRLLIGYFPEAASMADLSKLLPSKVISMLQEKFAGTPYTVMTNFEKSDPISGKKMKFIAISAKDQNTLKNIEQLF